MDKLSNYSAFTLYLGGWCCELPLYYVVKVVKILFLSPTGGDASTNLSAYNPATLYPNAAAATGRPLGPAYSLSPLSPAVSSSIMAQAPPPRSDLLLTSMPVATTASSYMMAAQNAKMAATNMSATSMNAANMAAANMAAANMAATANPYMTQSKRVSSI